MFLDMFAALRFEYSDALDSN